MVLATCILLQLGTICFHSVAAPGDLDLSFDAGAAVDGTVREVAIQPDGKVIIAGDFRQVQGVARGGVARLNLDGSNDSSFNPAESFSPVLAVALQPDGKVLVGHYRGILRLNSNGSVDTGFVPPEFYDGEFSNVRAIAVQPDGKVLIGGGFIVGEAGPAGIARLNPDGTVASGFFPPNCYVESIALQPDGKILIGGQVGGGFNGIARLNTNGVLDGSFDTGTGLAYENVYTGSVQSLALQTDGKILVGGAFTAINGTNRNNIARLNTNGSVDLSFESVFTNAPSGPIAARPVYSIALQSDGKILVGGYLNTVNGTLVNMARLNSNGSYDAAFTAGASHAVVTIAIQADGKLIVGGDFAAMNGVMRTKIARLHANGSLDETFNPGTGVDGAVRSLALQADGKLLMGGFFNTVKDFYRPRIARLNADGNPDSSFDAGTNISGISGNVSSIALQPDGKVLAVSSLSALHRFNTNGSRDISFAPELSPNDSVTAIALQSDGKIVVAGSTANFYCEPPNSPGYPDCYYTHTSYFVRRLRTNGSRDVGFNAGANPDEIVRVITLQPDFKILIGGDFHTVENASRNGIARLNASGTLDGSFNPATGVNGLVNSIVTQADGRVFLGGSFTTFNGTNRSGIARLNANGSLDNSFNPAAGGVYALALQPDGKLLIGGGFTVSNATNRNGIARLNVNGSLDGSFNASIGTNQETVYAIALQPDGSVLIGGSFITVNGVARPYLARLYGQSLPSLNIVRSNAFVIVSWSASAASFRLQEATNLTLPVSWSPVSHPRATNSGRIMVTISDSVGDKLFRLTSP